MYFRFAFVPGSAMRREIAEELVSTDGKR